MTIDRLLALVLLLAWPAATASAQCPLQWSGATEVIVDAAELPGGDLVVVGGFASIGGVAANNIARFDGITWAPLGSGLNGPGSHVAAMPNGDVVVAGSFTTAGGLPSPGLARWDGATWHAYPSAPPGPVEQMVALPNGDVVVARNVSPGPTSGYVEISRWDGVAWQVIGTSSGSTGTLPFATVSDLEVLPNGTLVAVGTWGAMNPMGWPGPSFYHELVAWNGASWDYFYDAPYPEDLLVTRRGDLYLACSSSLGSGVHHWSGGSWQVTTNLCEVVTIAELPNGDVVAAGYQTGQPWQMGCRRWNGTSWSDLGFWTPGVYGSIDFAVAHAASGRLFVSGSFSSAGGIPAANRAWLTTPCLPAALSTATSCVGPAGPLATFVPELPWTGGQLRTTTSGFGPSSLAVVVLGASAASLPLAGLLPTLSPGCNLLAAPDALLLAFPVGGVVDFAIDVPDVPALAGSVVYQQTAQLELLAGGIASASVANRLALTIGTF